LSSAFWQTTFELVFWMCVQSTAVTALWFQHSQLKPRFCLLLLALCNSEIHHYPCGITLKVYICRSHSRCFVHTHEHFWNPSCTKLVTA
jgi:hypothetical protein